jgi:prevent-host-death family protein
MEAIMRKIPATQFKAKCLDLMDRVAERRESYVITKRGRPVAQLVPLPRSSHESLFGCLRSVASIRGEIENPVLQPEAWETIENWDRLINLDRPAKTLSLKIRKNKASRR